MIPEISLLKKEAILSLTAEQVGGILSGSDIIHIAKELGCYWRFNYEKAKDGQIGYHAILKSGLHSDEFFNIRELLEYENIRRIIADQLGQQIIINALELGIKKEEIYCAGIPDGATKLGKDIAEICNLHWAEMGKQEGKIVLMSEIKQLPVMLLVEDVFTKGTATKEAYEHLISRLITQMFPSVFVVVNRSGSQILNFSNAEMGYQKHLKIKSLVETKPKEWDPQRFCPLCMLGSKAIKPKSPLENWEFFKDGVYSTIY